MKTISDLLAVSGPALAAAIANHLWQSSVLGLAILGLLGSVRNLSARTRLILARLALVKFALPLGLALSLVRHWANAGGGAHASVATAPATPHPAGGWTVLVHGADLNAPLVRECLGLAAGLWVAGFVALAGIWTIRNRRFQRDLLAAAEPLPNSQAEAVRIAAQQTGLRYPPRCLMVGASFGPGVLGAISPVVVLPRGIEAVLSPHELGAILVHEFVHLRSRDHLWNLVQVFLVSAFWFNPVIWLLRQRLNAEVEKSCDEQVLSITADPRSYANGIIKTVRLSLGLPQTGLVGAARPPVTARLDAILAYADRAEDPLLRLAVLGAALGLLAFSGYSGSIRLETIRLPAMEVLLDRTSAPIREFAPKLPPAMAPLSSSEPGNSAQSLAPVPPPSSAPVVGVKSANVSAPAIGPEVRDTPLATVHSAIARSIESQTAVQPPAAEPKPPAFADRATAQPASYSLGSDPSPSQPAASRIASKASALSRTVVPGGGARPRAIEKPLLPNLPRVGLIQDPKGASLDDFYFPAIEVIQYHHGS